ALVEFRKKHVRGGPAGVGRGPMGYEPRRAKAAATLTQAGRKGDLAIYMFQDRPILSEQTSAQRRDAASTRLTPIYPEIPNRLITSRDGFTDHPIRPTLKTAGGNENLFRSLAGATLLIRRTDFAAWCRAEHAKGRWPSQHARKKPHIGRPSKRTTG